MTTIGIIGASLAGLSAARAFRAEGFDGTITLIGDELHEPYDRPPLSKQYLSGAWDFQKCALGRTSDDALDIDWRLGTRAERLDGSSRRITTTDGEEHDFDGLVIACGASPVLIPGTAGVTGVHVLRTIDDANGLRQAFATEPARVVVIGAGFIGAEVASTCRGLGIEVTMVDVAEVPLLRGLGVEMGRIAADLHREHGVDLRLGVGLERIEGDPVERVVLADGSVIETTVVVIGVGVRPNTGWLESSGLQIDNGIVCDSTTLAAPGIAAAGDVAAWYSNRYRRHVRMEHWENAISHGEAAARRVLSGLGGSNAIPVDYDPTPWFWSDQYDVKFQLAGTTDGHDHVEVLLGEPGEHRFVAVYGQEGHTLGVLGVNRPRHVMLLRSHATDRTPLDAVRTAAAAL